jgi:hypothetical protein
VKPVNAAEHLAAIIVALGITFGIVSGMSNYAYSAPNALGPSQIVVRDGAKACS